MNGIIFGIVDVFVAHFENTFGSKTRISRTCGNFQQFIMLAEYRVQGILNVSRIPKAFLTFSGGIEMENLYEMD